ncbi:MAG: efflux RND transporter periplasmic adaptor subunit [Thermoanaerobaculia bacterium]
MKIGSRPIAAVPLVAALLVATVGCSRLHRGEADPPSSALVVAVAPAATTEVSRSVVLTAEFRPFQQIDVLAKVSGYVKTMNVDVGDRVREGQLLATLEVPELGDELAMAAAAVKRSEAEIERARQDLIRSQSAHEVAHLGYTRLDDVMRSRPGLVAQQELDDARGRDETSEAQESAARAAVTAFEEARHVAEADRARKQTLLDYARVTAPFAGVITERLADPGAMIQAGTASQTQARPLVRLSQIDRLRLSLPVPESAVPNLRLGDGVDVRVPSLGRVFPGKVARFAGQVRTATRTMETEVDVQNPDFVLVPGMYAEATLQLDRPRKALTIPVLAVDLVGGRATVARVDARGTLETVPVTLGTEMSDRYEVTSGLKEGDLVVIGSRSALKSGEVVTPKVTTFGSGKGES